MPSQPSLQEYDFAVTLVVLVQHNARMRAAHCELGLALLNHFGGARAALEALPGLARRGGGASGPQICLREQAREIEACGKLGVSLVALGSRARVLRLLPAFRESDGLPDAGTQFIDRLLIVLVLGRRLP